MQKKYGFEPLGPADGPVKRAILGENNARLYGYTPKMRAAIRGRQGHVLQGALREARRRSHQPRLRLREQGLSFARAVSETGRGSFRLRRYEATRRTLIRQRSSSARKPASSSSQSNAGWSVRSVMSWSAWPVQGDSSKKTAKKANAESGGGRDPIMWSRHALRRLPDRSRRRSAPTGRPTSATWRASSTSSSPRARTAWCFQASPASSRRSRRDERRVLVDAVRERRARTDSAGRRRVRRECERRGRATQRRRARSAPSPSWPWRRRRCAMTSAAQVDYYRRIAAERLPIILQNAPPPAGCGLSPERIAEIVAAVPGIAYVKEETLPCGQRITRLLELMPASGGRLRRRRRALHHRRARARRLWHDAGMRADRPARAAVRCASRRRRGRGAATVHADAAAAQFPGRVPHGDDQGSAAASRRDHGDARARGRAEARRRRPARARRAARRTATCCRRQDADRSFEGGLDHAERSSRSRCLRCRGDRARRRRARADDARLPDLAGRGAGRLDVVEGADRRVREALSGREDQPAAGAVRAVRQADDRALRRRQSAGHRAPAVARLRELRRPGLARAARRSPQGDRHRRRTGRRCSPRCSGTARRRACC